LATDELSQSEVQGDGAALIQQAMFQQAMIQQKTIEQKSTETTP
jgi:hypothetical protein